MDFPISVIKKNDSAFSSLLKEIHDPPEELYARGNIDLLQHNKLLAVVGSRKVSTYGKQACEKILPALIANDIVLVSGLAYGVDSLVHQACVNEEKPTIAVLGCGIDDASIYPRTNVKLANRILKHGGLLLSEYPEGTSARPYHFPKRNRIIAGLCPSTLLIQASGKSGSLITARLALEYNRNVYTIPGPITDPLSMGTNQLIQQGAYPVLHAKDILELYGISSEEISEKELANLTDQQEKILKTLSTSEPIHIDSISTITKEPSHSVSVTLLELELIGAAQHIGGMKYLKCSL